MLPLTELREKLAELTDESFATVTRLLDHCVDVLGSELQALVLYGSGAEGRLRPGSDVNLLLIIRSFTPSLIDPLREPLRAAQAAANVDLMFVLSGELEEVAVEFAAKFDDIRRRHVLLHGQDVLTGLIVPDRARLHRARQMLLNVMIRARERYALASLREEQMARLIGDMASPLRTAAALLLELQHAPAGTPKEALEQLVVELDAGRFASPVSRFSEARQQRVLAAGVAPALVLELIELSARLRELLQQQEARA